MKLSVVIPTLNEHDRVGRAVRLSRQAGAKEVIVVDGGSSDDTPEVAQRAGATVLETSVGRGLQQNLGARAARGDTLVFLHADTLLPPDFPEHVARTLGQPGVVGGAFRFKLDEDGWEMRLVERMVDARCRLWGLPYGDQALFMSATDFAAVGGFPETPIMEDYELVRRLRRLGRVVIADAEAVTSARRWRKLGLWRTTWNHQLCLAAYRLNVAPERIARWRG